MSTYTLQQYQAMPDSELELRLSMAIGACGVWAWDDDQQAMVYYPMQGWRNNGLPGCYRRVDFYLYPTEEGPPVGPGTFCSNAAYITWAESLITGYSPVASNPPLSPRNRTINALLWMDQHDWAPAGGYPDGGE